MVKEFSLGNYAYKVEAENSSVTIEENSFNEAVNQLHIVTKVKTSWSLNRSSNVADIFNSAASGENTAEIHAWRNISKEITLEQAKQAVKDNNLVAIRMVASSPIINDRALARIKDGSLSQKEIADSQKFATDNNVYFTKNVIAPFGKTGLALMDFFGLSKDDVLSLIDKNIIVATNPVKVSISSDFPYLLKDYKEEITVEDTVTDDIKDVIF